MSKVRPNTLIFILLSIILLATVSVIPIFNDESIYVKWTIASRHTGDLLYSLTHGDKPPLLTWILIPVTYLPVSPYLAGRLLMTGLTLLSGLFLGQGGLIFLSLPYTIIFGRQILAEPVVFLFVSLFLLQLKTNKPNSWLFLGLLFSFSFYLKFNLSLFLSLLLLPKLFSTSRSNLIVFLLPCVLLLSPFLLPGFRHLFTSQQQFFHPLFDITILIPRLQNLFIQSLYFLPILPLLSSPKKHAHTTFAIIVYLGVYLIAAPDANSRYLAPLAPALVSILDYSRPRAWMLSLFILASFFPRQFMLYTHQTWDYHQYYTYWTSGVGLDRLKNDISKQITQPTIIFIRPDSSHPEDFLVVNYSRSANPQIAYATPDNIKLAIHQTPSSYQLLFVSRDLQLPDPQYKLKLLSTYPKFAPQHFVNLYQIIRD